MRNFFALNATPLAQDNQHTSPSVAVPEATAMNPACDSETFPSPAELATFSSDELDSNDVDPDNGCEADNEKEEEEEEHTSLSQDALTQSSSGCLPMFRPLKRQRLVVPVHIQNEKRKEEWEKELKEAFAAIQKLLRSKC